MYPKVGKKQKTRKIGGVQKKYEWPATLANATMGGGCKPPGPTQIHIFLTICCWIKECYLNILRSLSLFNWQSLVLKICPKPSENNRGPENILLQKKWS